MHESETPICADTAYVSKDLESKLCLPAAGGQGSEAAPESFLQHPRYVEMCVRVMEAAKQQGQASSIPAWSQAVLQNIRAICRPPRTELPRFADTS